MHTVRLEFHKRREKKEERSSKSERKRARFYFMKIFFHITFLISPTTSSPKLLQNVGLRSPRVGLYGHSEACTTITWKFIRKGPEIPGEKKKGADSPTTISSARTSAITFTEHHRFQLLRMSHRFRTLKRSSSSMLYFLDLKSSWTFFLKDYKKNLLKSRDHFNRSS